MGDAIGQMLTSAVGIAISPLPLIAVILMLATPKGRPNGLAFTAGWIVAVALMVLIASLCALLPLGVYLAGGTRSAQVLGGWKAWMARHNSAIMTTLLLVLGVKYIGDALSGLTSWRTTGHIFLTEQCNLFRMRTVTACMPHRTRDGRHQLDRLRSKPLTHTVPRLRCQRTEFPLLPWQFVYGRGDRSCVPHH